MLKRSPREVSFKAVKVETFGLGGLDAQIEAMVSTCQSLCGCRKLLAMGLSQWPITELGQKRKPFIGDFLWQALQRQRVGHGAGLGLGEVSNNPAS